MVTESIISQIVSSVLEQGELSKEQVLEVWSLEEEDYPEVQRAVLKANEYIVKGPRRVGGFAMRQRKGRLTENGEGVQFDWKEEWERQTVDRLVELLSHAQLEELLGPLRETVRQARKELTGTDRRGSKPELATALFLNHGVDLFYNWDIRSAVGKAAQVKPPEKWHAGKGAATEFVKQAKFPAGMAGIPAGDAKPDYEFLEGRFNLSALQVFQEEVKTSLVSTLKSPGDRAIVTLPTGAGKTRVAVEGIKDWLTSRYDVTAKVSSESAVLWLAHTEELCDQAYACFRQVWEGSDNVCPLLLVRFWGKYTQDLIAHRNTLASILSRPSVLISTPQRMVNLLDGRVSSGQGVIDDLRKALGLLLVDEAHRAAAPSYRRIAKDLVSEERPVSVAGLTATPFRSGDEQEGAKELKDIFKKLIEPKETLGENPRQKLQEMKVLATPHFQTIITSTTLEVPPLPKDGLASEAEIERIDRVMAVRADNTPRRLAVLRVLTPLGKSNTNQILYFGPTVRDAESMAYLLRCEGITASVVSGNTRDVTRRQVINDFKKGNIRVLCNCEVLTTGFDAPRVTHVVMARPTVSRVLYEQIVGRGLRGPLFGGTEECVILDCEDLFRGERPQLGYERFRKIWYADHKRKKNS
jgi:superfamily II DNA or RNA helicase